MSAAGGFRKRTSRIAGAGPRSRRSAAAEERDSQRDQRHRASTLSNGIMSDLADISNALVASSRGLCVEVLRTELRIAQTMITLAVNTEDAAVQERRKHQAGEACAVVARHLSADGSPIVLSESERDELSEGLSAISQRLASA
jgi:hypothetical protein